MPQGLKPGPLCAFCGPAQAVPLLQDRLCKRFQAPVPIPGTVDAVPLRRMSKRPVLRSALEDSKDAMPPSLAVAGEQFCRSGPERSRLKP
jgi:hypothetical protein